MARVRMRAKQVSQVSRDTSFSVLKDASNCAQVWIVQVCRVQAHILHSTSTSIAEAVSKQ